MTAAGRRVGALLVVVLVAASCGGSSHRVGTAGRQIRTIDRHVVPADLNGLAIGQEDVSGALAGVGRSYVDAVGLYGLRAGDTLEATLQVAELSGGARYSRASFRDAVVSRIGSTAPKPFRIGRDTVYLTTGKKQNVSIWFRGRYFFVLSVRDDYDQPRTLLRQALGIRP